MDKVAEATKVNAVAAGERVAGVQIIPFENFAQIEQGLEN